MARPWTADVMAQVLFSQLGKVALCRFLGSPEFSLPHSARGMGTRLTLRNGPFRALIQVRETRVNRGHCRVIPGSSEPI